MNRADLTIIIPVYNRAGLIGRAIDSVVAQTLPPKRLIVVDNNSTDETPAVLQAYARRELPFELTILKETKRGASAARNRGLREAETPYILFFDSDDTIPVDHVRRIMAQFADSSQPDLISWQGRMIFPDGSSMLSRLPHGDNIISHLVHASFATSLMAMKTDLIRRVGGWNEDVSVWDDYELSLRLLLADPKIHSEGRIGGDFYLQEESQTGPDFISKQGKWELALNAMEETLLHTPHPDRTKYFRWLLYRRVLLAALYARETGDGYQSFSRFPADLVSHLPAIHRLALRLVYEYTRRGGRGAYYFYRLVNGW